MPLGSEQDSIADSPTAWLRLALCLVASTIGGVGLWSSVVVLPLLETEFGIDRGGASFPYTATMIGFAVGGILMGRLFDRFGASVPLTLAAIALGSGYVLSSYATSLWQFVACQALLIGFLGSSAVFTPMIADISHWFLRRRGMAVGIIASGSYLAGTIWPPILQAVIAEHGWRDAHFFTGLFCVATLLPLAWLLRRRAVVDQGDAPVAKLASRSGLPAPKPVLLGLLMLAGLGCCIAMSMPQVHIIAYCLDLGYGPAAGAEMLSLMLILGIVSRLVSGVIADRIGGVGTLILGSSLQCLALIFYLPFDGLMSLYLVSALFGLSQGGIVPSYTLIIREYFPAREAGTLVALVMTATILGMAVGGWLSGEIYDATGSYAMAFLNGILWNLVNLGVAAWLLLNRRGPARGFSAA